MDFLDTTLLFVGGLLASILNTVAGGGSFLTLPLLVFTGLPANVANASNRLFMCAQATVATLSLWRHERLPWRPVLALLLPSFLAALLGAYLATQIDPSLLKRGMGYLILTVLLFLLLQQLLKSRKAKAQAALLPKDRELCQTEALSPRPIPRLSLKRYLNLLPSLSLLGLYGGFIQAGLGAILVYFYHQHCKLSQNASIALKNALIAAYSLPVVLIFVWADQMAWPPALVLAVAGMLGGKIGSHVARLIPYKVLLLLLFVIMLASALSLIFG